MFGKDFLIPQFSNRVGRGRWTYSHVGKDDPYVINHPTRFWPSSFGGELMPQL
jgi:hypothetical protein